MTGLVQPVSNGHPKKSRGLFYHLLPIYLWVVPFIYLPGVHPRIAQEMTFGLSSIILILAGLMSPQVNRNPKENIWLFAFASWCVFLYCYFHFYTGPQFVVNIFYGIATYMIATRCLEKEDTKRVFKWILLVVVINFFYTIMQANKIDPLFSPVSQLGEHFVDPAGFFGIKMSLAIFFATALPMLAFFSPLAPILLAWHFYVCVCAGAVLGATVGYLFYLWHTNRKLAWLMLVPLILGGSFYWYHKEEPMGMTNTRPGMWYLTLQKSLVRPVTGYGLDSFRSIFPGKDFLFFRTQDGTKNAQNIVVNPQNATNGQVSFETASFWDNPHNSYIAILFETGVVGVVLMVGFLWACACRFGRSLKTRELVAVSACIVAFLFSCLTQFPDRLARNVYIMPIILALFMIHTETKEDAS